MLYFFVCCSFLGVFLFIFSRLFRKLNGAERKPMTSPKIKYDVFVSFRGEDIRDGFLGHLTEAFDVKKINAFVDDKLEKGEELWPSLVQAIQGSSIYLIIFSPHYASSTWCLKELVTILQCKDKYGHTVIPVFYHVKPTDVRHQSSDGYRKAFAEHARKHKNEVQLWRDVFEKSAYLSGIESSKFRNDADLLKAMVDLVLRRLTKSHVNSKGLVGIDKRIADVESLIHRESEKARLIGLWGMGGIGKTTLAEEVYNKLRFKYEGCYFLANVREQLSRHGKVYLRNEIFSALLLRDVKIDTPNSLPEYIVRRIRRMKVLIVLDDVNDSDHIEDLLGVLDNFGSGSIIIVTTRDEQVLKANKADEIYHLREFTSDEALELFNLNAFNQSVHQMQYDELSKRIVNYAKGLPLILKVLAHRLHGKNEEVWESELDKLKKVPPTKVYDVIKLSYDDLDRKEKQIFLDLACFFCISSVKISSMKITIDYLKYLLKDGERDKSVVVTLERLRDKALITISKDNVVYMHDSIKEMAWEIVRQESPEDPGNRSRLWDMDDIYEAFKNDKDNEAIRSIQINSVLLRWQEFVPHIAKMSRLRFVEIYGETFSFIHYNRERYFYNRCRQLSAEGQGLQFSATETRFLFWECYPLKSLPDTFSGEKLVILKLVLGRMEKLWDGVKNLLNLKELDLRLSRSLKELPDLSKATNIEVLNLEFCYRLTRLPSSFANNTKLLYLNVNFCQELLRIPELPLSLQTLYARNCRSLKTVFFHSTAVEQTKENRKKVSFDHCMNMDKPSLEAIGLNARINVMKFANQHLCAPKQDDFQNYNDYEKNYDSYQAFYCYPGSRFPEWLEYKQSAKYSVIINLSSAPPSPVYGFIWCFVLVGEVDAHEFDIVISDCEGKGITDRVRMKLNHQCRLVGPHRVVVMYDQRCSDFLNNIATGLTRFKIMVAWQVKESGRSLSLPKPFNTLLGFGVSIIRTSTYSSFVQQIKEAR